MLARERHKRILELLRKDGTVRTADLVEAMSVSSETVRKDLDYLEQSGQLERVHGGAVPVPKKLVAEPAEEYVSLAARNTQHMEEKSRIVRRAAALVKEKQVVALDYGSTSFLMAKELARRFRSLTVITNSVQNALALVKCPDFTIKPPHRYFVYVGQRSPPNGRAYRPGIQRGPCSESDAPIGQPHGSAGRFREIWQSQPGEDLRAAGNQHDRNGLRPGAGYGGSGAGDGSGADRSSGGIRSIIM